MRMWKVLLGVLLLEASTASFAATTAQICNGCSGAETQSDARDLGNGDHFFYDMTGQTLTHWSVSGVVIQVAHSGNVTTFTPSTTAHITNIPITADQQTAFNATQTLYNYFGTLSLAGKMTVTFNPPAAKQATHITKVLVKLPKPMVDGNGYANAYDVVNNSANMNAAIEAASDASTFGGYVMDSRAVISSFVNNAKVLVGLMPNPTTIVEEIDFPDSSYIFITYNYVGRVWQYVPGTAHDSQKNSIPDNLPAVAGANGSTTYRFNAGSAGFNDGIDAMNNFSSLGATVSSTGITSTTGWIVACVSGPGFKTTCTAYPQ